MTRRPPNSTLFPHPTLFRSRTRRTDQYIGQKRLEPEGALIFVAMNNLERQLAGDHRRPRGLEMKFHFPAVAALKTRRNFAFIGQAATLTKRRFDKAHALPATRPDVAFGRRGRFGITELTNPRIEKNQTGIKPAFQ